MICIMHTYSFVSNTNAKKLAKRLIIFVGCAKIDRMSILREKRLEKAMTLTAAARKIGANVGSLSRIERGQQYPRPALARRLCTLYGISMDDILMARADRAA